MASVGLGQQAQRQQVRYTPASVWKIRMQQVRSKYAEDRNTAAYQSQTSNEQLLRSIGYTSTGPGWFLRSCEEVSSDYGFSTPSRLRDAIRIRNKVSHELLDGSVPWSPELAEEEAFMVVAVNKTLHQLIVAGLGIHDSREQGQPRSGTRSAKTRFRTFENRPWASDVQQPAAPVDARRGAPDHRHEYNGGSAPSAPGGDQHVSTMAGLSAAEKFVADVDLPGVMFAAWLEIHGPALSFYDLVLELSDPKESRAVVRRRLAKLRVSPVVETSICDDPDFDEKCRNIGDEITFMDLLWERRNSIVRAAEHRVYLSSVIAVGLSFAAGCWGGLVLSSDGGFQLLFRLSLRALPFQVLVVAWMSQIAIGIALKDFLDQRPECQRVPLRAFMASLLVACVSAGLVFSASRFF